jgi:hypothetical protein
MVVSSGLGLPVVRTAAGRADQVGDRVLDHQRDSMGIVYASSTSRR